ncbi:MAG: hypothetical protein AABX53_02060 [Nanoarchaeota archaeon]
MQNREVIAWALALVTLTIVIGFGDIIKLNLNSLGAALFFAFLILASNGVSKKIAAKALDADVEHDIWYASRYGFKPGQHLTKHAPLGIILPLFVSAFSLGAAKCMTLLTYQTSALKRRAAKRFGYYSFTEMTDWHNALVGAAGVMGVLLLAIIAYAGAIDGLPSIAIYYAFWNMIPWSKLDGAQIFMGSKVLYTALGLITIAMTVAALVIP